MQPAKSRIASLEDQISSQIERLAELICDGKPAVEAMQVLDSLSRELVAEEHHLHLSTKDRICG